MYLSTIIALVCIAAASADQLAHKNHPAAHHPVHKPHHSAPKHHAAHHPAQKIHHKHHPTHKKHQPTHKKHHPDHKKHRPTHKKHNSLRRLEDADAFVANYIKINPCIVIGQEGCSYCEVAQSIFQASNAAYGHLDIGVQTTVPTGNQTYAAFLKLNGQDSIPMVYIGGQFIGGSSDLKALQDKGELSALAQSAGCTSGGGGTTHLPTEGPTGSPSGSGSGSPTDGPTGSPSGSGSGSPTDEPTGSPSGSGSTNEPTGSLSTEGSA